MKPTATKILVTAISVLLLAYHLRTKSIDAIGLGLLALVLLPWLSSILDAFELPGGIRFQFRRVQEQQERQAEELAWIKLLITLVISEFERTHLRHLAAPGPFMAQVKRSSTFEWELRHLLSLKLIDRLPGKGIRSLFAEEGQRDVKEHLGITQRGQDYLHLLEQTKV